jgi:hypothetical protein
MLAGTVISTNIHTATVAEAAALFLILENVEIDDLIK